MPALENTGPPGSLKPFSSQGATALPPPLIQSFAALIRSAARHDGVDQIQRLGLGEIDRLALQQQLHRILRRHDARHALGAAGAGEQADLDFRQAEPGLGIFRGDAVVAGSVSSKPPPSARPLIAATHGLPEVSMERNTCENRRLWSNSIWLAATSPFSFSSSA